MLHKLESVPINSQWTCGSYSRVDDCTAVAGAALDQRVGLGEDEGLGRLEMLWVDKVLESLNHGLGDVEVVVRPAVDSPLAKVVAELLVRCPCKSEAEQAESHRSLRLWHAPHSGPRCWGSSLELRRDRSHPRGCSRPR